MGSANGWTRVRVEHGIYLLPHGKYAVSARRAGRLCSRTVGSDLALARTARVSLVASLEAGLEPVAPRLRFGTVAGWWLARFEARVAAGERRERTLEAHRYHLERHLLPVFWCRRTSSISVDDVAELLDALRRESCSATTAAKALATLHSIVRFARRYGWIADDPVERLEPSERPRPPRRRQRVLGWAEIGRLLGACTPRDRLLIATSLYTGLRTSELLGLIWDDLDLAAGVIHVRAQLSRAAPRRAGAASAHQDAGLGARRPACAPAGTAAGRPPAPGESRPAATGSSRPRRGHRSGTATSNAHCSAPRGSPGSDRHVAATAVPRSAPHLRQPPDPRPRPRRRPGQPDPRPRQRHDHT